MFDILSLDSKIRMILFACTLGIQVGFVAAQQQDWSHYVRIAGHTLSSESIDDIITKSVETNVFGIEVDNDPPGRYESFLDPLQKLADLKEIAGRAQAINNYTFAYIAGLECITANADKTGQTFYKEHPGWVQRDINNRPALFSEKDAFWIKTGDEDVWISPFAPGWRKHYMEQVRQVAATGINGVYVDIPYWMTHFEGWTDTWASFDDYTVAAFKEKTGLDARRDIKPGDFGDAGFRKWLHFRMQAIKDFMREIDHNVKQVNPACKTIAEIYPGLDMEAVRVGADVYQLYDVVDVIAHEYSEGAYMASDRKTFDWLRYMAGMYSFRAFAGDKPSWMLSYSWDGNKNVAASEAMKWLFMSQVMAGTNSWDPRGHIMSQSNDYATRKKIFGWIKSYERHFYRPRKAVKAVGIYFSPATRDLFPDEFYQSYMGWMLFLLQSHWPFEIVTPRTLDKFDGEILVLPDVKIIAESEKNIFNTLIKSKKMRFVISGECGVFNESRKRNAQPILDFPAGHRVLRFESNPAKIIFNDSTRINSGQTINKDITDIENTIKSHFNWEPFISMNLTDAVTAQTVMVDGKLCIFIANFSDLPLIKGQQRGILKNITILLNETNYAKGYILPFLGQPQEVKLTQENGSTKLTVPELTDAALLWLEK